MLPYMGQIMTATYWAHEWEIETWIMLQDSFVTFVWGVFFHNVKKLQKVHINGNEFKLPAAADS